MNRLGTTLSQVLIGTLTEGAQPQVLGDALISAGKESDDVVVLAGKDGLQRLLGRGRGNGVVGQLTKLIRHIEALDREGTGHVLSAAERDLRAGHTVAVVRHVASAEAAQLSDLMHLFGVPHVHYIGRWTVAEHETVPVVPVSP